MQFFADHRFIFVDINALVFLLRSIIWPTFCRYFHVYFLGLNILLLGFKFHRVLSLCSQLKISRHLCKQKLGAQQMTNDYLSQWWLGSLTDKCSIHPTLEKWGYSAPKTGQTSRIYYENATNSYFFSKSNKVDLKFNIGYWVQILLKSKRYKHAKS